MGKAEKEVIFMYYQKETVEVLQELSSNDAGLSKEEVEQKWGLGLVTIRTLNYYKEEKETFSHR